MVAPITYTAQNHNSEDSGNFGDFEEASEKQNK